MDETKIADTWEAVATLRADAEVKEKLGDNVSALVALASAKEMAQRLRDAGVPEPSQSQN